MTTWRKELLDEMARHGETWADVIKCTMTDEELDADLGHAPFDDCVGLVTVFTSHRVYVQDEHYGDLWIRSFPLNPPEQEGE